MPEDIFHKSSAAFPSVIHAKEAQEVTWFSTMVGWGFFVLVLSIGFYAGIEFYYLPTVKNDTASITANMNQLFQKEIPRDQRDAVMQAYSQVLNIKELLASHTYLSRTLMWVEHNTQKNISIDTMTVSLERNTIELTGKGPDKTNIAEQVVAFESADGVKSVSLTDAQFQTVPASFHMTIYLKPDFTFSTQ